VKLNFDIEMAANGRVPQAEITVRNESGKVVLPTEQPKLRTLEERQIWVRRICRRFQADCSEVEPVFEQAWLTAYQRLQEQEAAVALATAATSSPDGRNPQAEQEKRLRDIEPGAFRVLDDPAVLSNVGEALQHLGLVGERENSLLLYLCVLSQITAESISAAVKGDSSGGKSFLVKSVLEVVPGDAHIDITSMSERALIYDDRDYKHKTVVIFEAHGQGGELASYLIRTLVSEGQIRHKTVESTPQGLVGREIVKEGPTNFLTTTTMPELHAENETRTWTILVDDSPKTTRGVLAVQAQKATGTFRPCDVSDLQAAFEWLAAVGAKDVTVPFADVLAAAMPDRPLRIRRDFPRLLQLIKVCALLHQRQRQLDDQGRVIASLADYAMARELVIPIFLRAIAGVTEKTMELVEALQHVLATKATKGIERDKARASYSDLVGETCKPKHYVSRWLRPALEIGLVDNETAGEKGRPAALKMGKFQVEEGGVLPTVEEVARKLNVAVRWISPITGRETVLQCCNSDCNGQGFTQVHDTKEVLASGGGSVAVLQSGEGGHCSPPSPVRSSGLQGGENRPPSPHCNTATVVPTTPASPSTTGASDHCRPLQSELQRSATPTGDLPAGGEGAWEVFEL
jgi:hypothetical protein